MCLIVAIASINSEGHVKLSRVKEWRQREHRKQWKREAECVCVLKESERE